MGESYLLIPIAVAVIGGTTLAGGRGLFRNDDRFDCGGLA
jgi:ribose/xylose/arabinose/galactoside ABC-type transport system permease subunit